MVDNGFDRLAAYDDSRFDRIKTGLDDRLDGIQAALDDVLDLLAAPFNNVLDGLAAAEDRVFHRAGHQLLDFPYSAPAPGTGSIIIFIEPGWGCEAISMAAAASSNGKRCEINWVRSKPLR